jgi:hypothetical protein
VSFDGILHFAIIRVILAGTKYCSRNSRIYGPGPEFIPVETNVGGACGERVLTYSVCERSDELKRLFNSVFFENYSP